MNQGTAAIHMFLGRLRTARWAVPLLNLVSSVIYRQERPCARFNSARLSQLVEPH